jgi:hypothetical protein
MSGYIKKSDAQKVVLHKCGDAARAAIADLPCEDVIPVEFIWEYIEQQKKFANPTQYGLCRLFAYGMIDYYHAKEKTGKVV